MKRISSALAAVGLALFLTGMSCPVNQQTIAYKSLYSVETSATAALDGYLDLVAKGQVSTNSLAAIGRDYNNLQAALRVATTLVMGNTNAPAPQSVLDASAHLTTEITNAK